MKYLLALVIVVGLVIVGAGASLAFGHTEEINRPETVRKAVLSAIMTTLLALACGVIIGMLGTTIYYPCH